MSTTAVVALVFSLLFGADVSDAQRGRNLRNFQNFQQNYFGNNDGGGGGGGFGQITRFHLYSRETEQRVELYHSDINVLLESGFNSSVDSKFIIHGWRSNSQDQYTNTLANAYLAHTDANVIAVDYSRIASSQYNSAVGQVHSMGRSIAYFVDWLVTEAGVSAGAVHMMGYSLGAHIAGAAGEHSSVGLIGRITGLDSAGPGFGSATSGRLDASDAQFVDAIHTCGGSVGYAGAHGHADFYPNGGRSQPGCGGNGGSCSHSRSYQTFAESIYSDVGFVATSCGNWQSFTNGYCNSNPTALMGEYVDRSVQGDFYLYTAASPPYALG